MFGRHVIGSVAWLNTAPPPHRPRPSTRRRRWSFPVAVRCTYLVPTSNTASGASSTGTPQPKSPWCASRSASITNNRGSACATWRHGSPRCAARRLRLSVQPTSCCATPMAPTCASWRRTRPCICTRARRGPRVPESKWVATPCRTWCWRWTTPPTCAAASCPCTNRGASRRCGSRCLTSLRRAARPVCAPA